MGNTAHVSAQPNLSNKVNTQADGLKRFWASMKSKTPTCRQRNKMWSQSSRNSRFSWRQFAAAVYANVGWACHTPQLKTSKNAAGGTRARPQAPSRSGHRAGTLTRAEPRQSIRGLPPPGSQRPQPSSALKPLPWPAGTGSPTATLPFADVSRFCSSVALPPFVEGMGRGRLTG